MLTRVDRVQLAVPDATAAAHAWGELLGAETAGVDRVETLHAHRTSCRLGDGWVEFLEPDGAGPVDAALSERGAHLFAAGVSTPALGALCDRLRAHGVDATVEADQIFLGTDATGGHGLRLVVSEDIGELGHVGAIEHLYEVTNLVEDTSVAVACFADLFGLDSSAFVPIESEFYGYRGTLTLFSPARLDRIEVITPSVGGNTMGRFYARFHESLYMAFAEADDLAALEARFEAHGVPHTSVPRRDRRADVTDGPDTIFVHPPALAGMMLGLSRPGHAWVWSGRPQAAGGDEVPRG